LKAPASNAGGGATKKGDASSPKATGDKEYTSFILRTMMKKSEKDKADKRASPLRLAQV